MVNARVAWVTKYDLSFKKRKRKIHFRSSGFSSQDFYTATVLHLILSASFNYENESSFINSSSLKLPTAGQVTQCSGNKRPLARCIWDCCGGAGSSAVLDASLLNHPAGTALPEVHGVCIFTPDALETLCNSVTGASCPCDGRCVWMQNWGPWLLENLSSKLITI